MVAHEGIYWMCKFGERDFTSYALKPEFKEAFKNSTYVVGDDPQLLEEKMDRYWLHLTGNEIRDIIVSGGSEFLNRMLIESAVGSI